MEEVLQLLQETGTCYLGVFYEATKITTRLIMFTIEGRSPSTPVAVMHLQPSTEMLSPPVSSYHLLITGNDTTNCPTPKFGIWILVLQII